MLRLSGNNQELLAATARIAACEPSAPDVTTPLSNLAILDLTANFDDRARPPGNPPHEVV